MASSSTVVAAERPTSIGRDEPREMIVEKKEEKSKIRISKIGGRYLVFDVDDVAQLRRRHNMCAILMGITPQAPNQNTFSGLPLELTADEVRWLVHERRAAYVADDLQAHLASLAQPAARRAYLESVRRQRQAAQAVADEVAAQRERRGAEVRANMAAKRVDRKSKKATNKVASKSAGETKTEEETKPKDTKSEESLQTQTDTQTETQPVKEAKEAPSVPSGTKAEAPVTAAVAVPHKVIVATATDRANDHADSEPLLKPTPRTEEVMQKEDALIFGGPVEVERMKAERDRQISTVQQKKESEAETETSTSSTKKEEKRAEKPETKKPAALTGVSPPVQITPTTSDGLVGAAEAEDDIDAVAPALSSTLSPSAYSAASLRAHLANRGYYTTPGLRFGGALSVYPGDPFRYHAHFVATTYGWDEPIPLLDIVSQGRLATGVKKGLLIGSAKPAESGGSGSDGEADVRTFTLEWAAI